MISSIQYLRFFAAFIVVVAHSGLGMYGVSGQVTNLGGFGVDLFFVISGFIMPFIIYGAPSVTPSPARYSGLKFMWLRISRIWPMYFVATMAVVFVSYLVANSLITDVRADLAFHFNRTMLDPWWLLESLTFTHGLSAPVLGLGWTLQVEFIFYSSIAVLLFVTRNINQLMTGLVLVFLLANVCLFIFPGNSFSPSYSNPLLIEFGYGFLIYSLLSRDIRMPPKAALAILILAIPVFLAIDTFRFSGASSLYYRALVWGSVAFAVVYSAMSVEHMIKQSRVLTLLGDASYSLYLVHYTIVPVLVHYWTKNGLETKINAALYLALVLVLCHVVAMLVHLGVEVPVNKLIRRAGERVSSTFMLSPEHG